MGQNQGWIRKLLQMEPAEAIRFLDEHVITADGLKGGLVITPKEDFDPESVDFVICGYAGPGAYRSEGAIDVECSDCKVMVILSSNSPVKPPKLCFRCAQARENEEQSIKE